ncbi:hypothetical protein SteCoe_1077 [Stentor coeruleus]|uniref:Uncharacterized protein n=1 Tax=Stentor coeruleus TaxID=5963 RepID=A0A1R2D2I7_9CILI|nr:hypothetical protein SteCoe_1077 [Stentor coeruleus]
MSKNWVIGSTSDQDLLIFRDPFIASPKPISFPETVSEISCNQGMALLLTCQGCIWLIGEDLTKSNLFTIEGLYKSETPIKMQSVINNFAISASIGTSHAGMVSAEGFLYTWGKGDNDELGNKRIKSCMPTRVENGNIFKSRQVVCIEKYTGIITQGGFLYVYGKSRNCHCGGLSGYPFIVPELEEHYVNKAYSSDFGIVILTEAGKVFIVLGCQCIVNLKANHKIENVATCLNGICGLTRDRKNIYVWESARDDKGWDFSRFKVMNCELEALVSGWGRSVVLAANDLGVMNLAKYCGSHSPEGSPLAEFDNDRTSFEQLFGSIDFGIQITKESIRKEECCKTLALMLSRCLAEPFRKIKEFSYLQWVYKRAYASTFTPNILGKIIQRINTLDKSLAFSSIFQYAKSNKSHPPQKTPISLITKVMNIKLRKNFLNLMKKGYKGLYYKLTAKFTSRLILHNRLIEYFKQLIPFLKYIKNKTNPFHFALKITERQNKSKVLKSFQLWSTITYKFSKKNMLNSEKLNSALWICVKLNKILKKTYRLSFSALSQFKNNNQIKYGLFFLCSCISKLQNKQKSYTFNSILRQKARPIGIENIIEVLKILIRSRYSNCFSSLKFYCINMKNKSIIRFILMLQGIQEKVRYRQVIRGYNCFRTNSFNRSLLLDFGSDRSFNMRSMCKMLVTPPSESPTLELTLPMTERSTYEAFSLNTERRSSAHNFQQILVKKITDRLANESKSNIIKPKNVADRMKQHGNDRRLAYGESIKERQKKKIQSKSIKEPTTSSQNITRKPSLTTTSIKQHTKSLIIDQSALKTSKYRTSLLSLEKTLSKITIIRLKMPFNKIRFYIKSLTQNSKYQVTKTKITEDKIIHRSTCNIFQINEPNKRKLSIETGKNQNQSQKYGIKINGNVYDSPIESPIPIRGEDNFNNFSLIPPPTPSMDLITLHPNPIQQSPSAWKIKLYALGLNKFARTFKMLVGKRLFEVRHVKA